MTIESWWDRGASHMSNVYHSLLGGNFSQNWSNLALLSADDNWSAIPSIIGYRGDNLTDATGTDPQTLTAEDAARVVDVNVNQTAPNTFNTGGVTEFEIADPTIALSGSGTADAPYLVIHLDTTGVSNIVFTFNARDIDGSADNAVQPLAVQYRIGSSGAWINLPAGFVADATTANAATQVTPVSVTLPTAADNQGQVQLRVITTNAVGNDEWVGIDDIQVTATPRGQRHRLHRRRCHRRGQYRHQRAHLHRDAHGHHGRRQRRLRRHPPPRHGQRQ